MDTLTHPPIAAPAPAQGAPSLRRFQSRYLDDHTEQLDWQLDYDQIDRGAFTGDMQEVRLPGLQLFRETTSRALRQLGGIQHGAIGVARMHRGQGSLLYQGQPADRHVIVCGPGQEIDMCTPPACTLVGLVVDADLLLKHAPVDTPDDALPRHWFASAFAAKDAEQSVLINFVGDSLDLIAARPQLLQDAQAVDQLRDAAVLHSLNALAQTHDTELRLTASARKRVVDRACELMLSRPDEPPSLLAICQQVGVSPRKLGYCFQEVLGLSPQAFLRVLRLNAARRELARHEQPQTSVYDVAARWGFWHFGRFSTDYKRQFGESPSSTLKRGQQRLPMAQPH